MRRIVSSTSIEEGYSEFTPIEELVEAFTKIKLREGYSEKEAKSIADTVLKLVTRQTIIGEEIRKLKRLRKRIYKILNKRGSFEEFHIALFSKDPHEKPF